MTENHAGGEAGFAGRGRAAFERAQAFIDAIPHAHALGLKLVQVGGGAAQINMPWQPALQAGPAGGMHHGAVTALLDTCCGAAVLGRDEAGLATATIDLRLDLLQPAQAGEAILCQAQIVKAAGPAAFLRAEAWQNVSGSASEKRCIATATGVFTIEPPRPETTPLFAPRLASDLLSSPVSPRPASAAGGADTPLSAYEQFLGLEYIPGSEPVQALMPFAPYLVGNPVLPALHGGASAAFLQLVAGAEVTRLWRSRGAGAGADRGEAPVLIDITVDYLRSGLPQLAHGEARVIRAGRRYASVHVKAWQQERERPFVEGVAHFLMPGACVN